MLKKKSSPTKKHNNYYNPFLKTKIKVVHLQSNISLSNTKAPAWPHSQTLRRELNRSIDRYFIWHRIHKVDTYFHCIQMHCI